MSRRQHICYLRKKLMAVRIWCDDSCSLFKSELKVRVQVFTNQLAGQCHKRVHEMVAESDGHLLASFCWTPERGEFFLQGSTLSSQEEDETMLSILPQRQDDERVRALQTGDQDLLERQVERNDLWLQHRKTSRSIDSFCSESVYIAQLHRRAAIIDRAFKTKVVDGLRSTLTSSSNASHAQTPPLAHSSGIETNPEHVGSIKSLRRMPISSTIGASTELSTGTDATQVGFQMHGQQVQVEVYFAPIKKQDRMREKLSRYVPPNPRCEWPLTAYITDPVRLSIVCDGPTQILEMVRWFVESQV